MKQFSRCLVRNTKFLYLFLFFATNRNANFCYFLQWQCNLFKFLCIGNANFLILAFAIQMFCIFCIGNILLFIFGTGNANLFYFRHWKYIFLNFWRWECKFLLFFALGMQTFLFFALGMQIFFIFSIDENDTILKTFLPFKCTKLTISFCNLYLPQKHPLALDLSGRKRFENFQIFQFLWGGGRGYKRLQTYLIHVCIVHTYKDCRA